MSVPSHHLQWVTAVAVQTQKVTEQGDINPNHLNNSSLKTFPSQTHSQEQSCNKVEVCDLSRQSICTQQCTSSYMYCLQRMEHPFKNSFLSGLQHSLYGLHTTCLRGRRGVITTSKNSLFNPPNKKTSPQVQCYVEITFGKFQSARSIFSILQIDPPMSASMPSSSLCHLEQKQIYCYLLLL